MPIKNHLIKAYEFLRQHEDGEFEIDEFEGYCGWSKSTIKTYIYKLWNQFAIKVDVNRFRVNGISSITLEEFKDQLLISTKYMRSFPFISFT